MTKKIPQSELNKAADQLKKIMKTPEHGVCIILVENDKKDLLMGIEGGLGSILKALDGARHESISKGASEILKDMPNILKQLCDVLNKPEPKKK